MGVSMELTWWNKKTYDDVCNFFATEDSCAIVNATGTGKTSVIAAVIKDYVPTGKILVIAPRDSILEQHRGSRYGLSEFDNISFITYQELLLRMRSGSISEMIGYSLIVCDELHRAGAREWGKAVQILLKLNPGVKLLGATATPRRRDQREEESDMVDLLFGGNRAGNFDLKTALKVGILPKPTYVASMYSLTEEVKVREELISGSKLKESDKRMFLEELKESEISWSTSHSYDKILERHLSGLHSDTGIVKILVFCKSISHIKEIRKNFDPVFHKIFAGACNLFIGEYHTKTSDTAFIKFRDSTNPGHVMILYSVEKFNEGVHVDNLNAVIMLRQTESEIIYYQQVGRVLSIGYNSNNQPLIIDFVNNFRSVNGLELWQSVLEPGYTGETREYGERTDGSRTLKVYFYDNIRDVIKLFESIDRRIEEANLYTYNGETGSILYFANKYNKPYDTIWKKVKGGMTIREAILTTNDVVVDMVTWEGKKISLADLCKKKGKNVHLIKYRLDHGKTIEEAMA